jgi:hypothetical protein
MLWCGEPPGLRRILVSDYNPLDHLPDPSKRYQALAILRDGVEVEVEIVDVERKQGVVLPFIAALQVAADINLEIARIMEVIADQVADGTFVAYQRLKSEWGPHGEGTAEQN